MTAAWAHIVGIGEDGLDGLSAAANEVVRSAEVIFGGRRHHALTEEVEAKRETWPSPFDVLAGRLNSYRGKRVVVLVSGDPLWYSAGVTLRSILEPAEMVYHPNVSAFQWAAARMGWPMAELDTLSVHGHSPERVIRFLAPGARLLVLASDSSTPGQVARILTARGYGPSRLSALAHIGGAREQRTDGIASDWSAEVADMHTLAIECASDPATRVLPCVPGLPDDAFVHDGKLTKREVRAATVAKLAPGRGALLWDVGLGCGSVAIEWLRAAPGTGAIGVEPREDRRSLAAENALALGVPDLEIVAGSAPRALEGLAPPDAVFIGGGLSRSVFSPCWDALKPGGRLVANVVTLESEAVLLELADRHGGELVRFSLERVVDVGRFHGWKPQMPVLQWSLSK